MIASKTQILLSYAYACRLLHLTNQYKKTITNTTKQTR